MVMRRAPPQMESERDGQCPHCKRETLLKARVPLEPPWTGHEFVRCHTCNRVHARPIVGDSRSTGAIHPHDIRLIRAHLDRLAELGAYDFTARRHEKDTLLMLAEQAEGPLHEASIHEFGEVSARPGRPFNMFLLYVNGRSDQLMHSIQQRVGANERDSEDRECRE